MGVDAAPWPTARGQAAPRGHARGLGAQAPAFTNPGRPPNHRPCPSLSLHLHPCPRPGPQVPRPLHLHRPSVAGLGAGRSHVARLDRTCAQRRTGGGAGLGGCGGVRAPVRGGVGGRRPTGDGRPRTVANRRTSGRPVENIPACSQEGLPEVRQQRCQERPGSASERGRDWAGS